MYPPVRRRKRYELSQTMSIPWTASDLAERNVRSCASRTAHRKGHLRPRLLMMPGPGGASTPGRCRRAQHVPAIRSTGRLTARWSTRARPCSAPVSGPGAPRPSGMVPGSTRGKCFGHGQTSTRPVGEKSPPRGPRGSALRPAFWHSTELIGAQAPRRCWLRPILVAARRGT